jgi:predicted MPP superfamily phosphohydrolase
LIVGLQYGLGDTNVVACLISGGRSGARLTHEGLEEFLWSLGATSDSSGSSFISGSPERVAKIQGAARDAQRELASHPRAQGADFVEESVARRVLGPLSVTFSSYDVYVMPVGTWRDVERMDRFANDVAHLPGHDILVLIPNYYDPRENLKVLDPIRAASDALKHRDLWPGAIFILRNGQSTFLPLDEGYRRLGEVADVISSQHREGAQDGEGLQRRLSEIITRPRQAESNPNRRLIHLSDLHFGTDRASETQVALQIAIKKRNESVDQIVITGDLFDQPRKGHAQQFRNFCQQLQMISDGRKPIVVPGNHDQRVFGNDFRGFGRRLRELADLEWQQVFIDDQSRLVFLCFESSRSQDLARGEVDGSQLLRVGTQWETDNVSGKFDEYMKVALVHHHPYPYATPRETTILDPRGWVGRESFIEMRGAEQLLSWCSGREVSLLLHGHKHIPRLIKDYVSDGATPPSYREITTVGCGSSLGAGNKPLSFNVVDWQPETKAWTVDFQVDRGDGQGFKSAFIDANVIAAA